LDFFTRHFNRARVFEIVGLLSALLNKKAVLTAQSSGKSKIKMLVFSIPITSAQALKIDFIQEYLNFIKPPKAINGIMVLSLEDIYIRKIYAATGTAFMQDSIGRNIAKGGRQEAKDFYDLYCLSHTFMRLSDFSFRYGNPLMREAIIGWFRTYSRPDIKTGLLELKVRSKANYQEMERHFKKEIDKMIERSVEFI
jgi:hypothetical protein